jgi:hypothetical protein
MSESAQGRRREIKLRLQASRLSWKRDRNYCGSNTVRKQGLSKR